MARDNSRGGTDEVVGGAVVAGIVETTMGAGFGGGLCLYCRSTKVFSVAIFTTSLGLIPLLVRGAMSKPSYSANSLLNSADA